MDLLESRQRGAWTGGSTDRRRRAQAWGDEGQAPVLRVCPLLCVRCVVSGGTVCTCRVSAH